MLNTFKERLWVLSYTHTSSALSSIPEWRKVLVGGLLETAPTKKMCIEQLARTLPGYGRRSC